MNNNSPKSLWQSLDTAGKIGLITLVLLAWNTSILIWFIPTMLKVNSVATKIESTIKDTKDFFGN